MTIEPEVQLAIEKAKHESEKTARNEARIARNVALGYFVAITIVLSIGGFFSIDYFAKRAFNEYGGSEIVNVAKESADDASRSASLAKSRVDEIDELIDQLRSLKSSMEEASKIYGLKGLIYIIPNQTKVMPMESYTTNWAPVTTYDDCIAVRSGQNFNQPVGYICLERP